MTEESNGFTIKEYLLYKTDRTLAILGIVLLGAWSLYVGTSEAIQIANVALGGLIGYVGGRSASK